MGEPFGDLAVVGEHQHSGGGLVQASYGEYAGVAALQQVHDGLAGMGVAGGGDIALGLVHHDIYLLLALETLAVEADVVGEDVDLGSELGDDLAVDGDYAGLDEGVGLTPGAYAGIGDELVEADLVLDRSGYVVVVGELGVVDVGPALDHTVDALFRALVEEGILLAAFAADGLGALLAVRLAGTAVRPLAAFAVAVVRGLAVVPALAAFAVTAALAGGLVVRAVLAAFAVAVV